MGVLSATFLGPTLKPTTIAIALISINRSVQLLLYGNRKLYMALIGDFAVDVDEGLQG